MAVLHFPSNGAAVSATRFKCSYPGPNGHYEWPISRSILAEISPRPFPPIKITFHPPPGRLRLSWQSIAGQCQSRIALAGSFRRSSGCLRQSQRGGAAIGVRPLIRNS